MPNAIKIRSNKCDLWNLSSGFLNIVGTIQSSKMPVDCKILMGGNKGVLTTV